MIQSSFIENRSVGLRVLSSDQIGADGYSADAPGAVKLVKQLVA